MSVYSTIGSIVTGILKGMDVQKIMTMIILYFIVALMMPISARVFIATKFPEVGHDAAYYVLLLPISFFLMMLMHWGLNKIKKQLRKRAYKSHCKEVVSNLTSEEKNLLADFFQLDYTDVIYVEAGDNIAQALIKKRVLCVLSAQIRFNVFDTIPVKISKDYKALIHNAYRHWHPGLVGYPDF